MSLFQDSGFSYTQFNHFVICDNYYLLFFHCFLIMYLMIVVFSSFVSVPAIIKVHGAHLKASAAMVRLRLYDILALLPPKTYEGTKETSTFSSQKMRAFIGGPLNSVIFLCR